MIDKLPTHIIARILSYLDDNSLICAVSTCKILWSVANLNHAICSRMDAFLLERGYEIIYREGVNRPIDIVEVCCTTDEEADANAEEQQEEYLEMPKSVELEHAEDQDDKVGGWYEVRNEAELELESREMDEVEWEPPRKIRNIDK